MAAADDKSKADPKPPQKKVWKIRTPVRDLTRKHGPFQVHIINGQAATENPAVAEWAEECGYEVTGPDGKVRNPLLEDGKRIPVE